MKKKLDRVIPFPAADAEWPDPFAWPRVPTQPLVQVPFDFESIEKKGDIPCEWVL